MTNHIDRITVLAQMVALTEMVDQSGDASFEEYAKCLVESDTSKGPSLETVLLDYLNWANGPAMTPNPDGSPWPDTRAPEIVARFKCMFRR